MEKARNRAGRGILISIEGGEGAGKTTAALAVKEKLAAAGIPVIYTREPGGIAIAEQIRDILLDPANTEMDPLTEAVLYAASRRQHLVQKVIPALEEGKVVLCDRFLDSSLAYQGKARNLGMERILKLNEMVLEDTMPDHTFYLVIEPEEGLKRASARGELNRLDQEALAFHQLVKAGYDEAAALFPERIEKIDATKDPETLANELSEKIEALWKARNA